jgi:DNA repair exonuclease SbcCD nuclease subunit
MFDTRTVGVNIRNAVKDIIWRNPEIDFLYLRGNHDAESFLNKMEEIPDNLCLFSNQWTTYSYDKVTITGVELDQENALTVYNTLVLDHDKFNIVTMHGQLNEYKNKDKTEVVSLDPLKNKNIDYLALGHVHAYQMDALDARGVYCYSGCLEGRGFDECDEKGFVLLDIDTRMRTATTEFIPFAARTLYTLPVDVTGIHTTQDAAERMEAAIAQSGYPSNSLVKFLLCGEVDVECELSTEFLEEQFAEYFYFSKVVDETKLMVNYKDYENDISLKGEFIRLVSSTDLTEEEKSLIIRTGIQALQGEEISL